MYSTEVSYMKKLLLFIIIEKNTTLFPMQANPVEHMELQLTVLRSQEVSPQEITELSPMH